MIPSRQYLWPLILCAIATISSRALCATDVPETVATELHAAQTAYDQGVESARTDPTAAQKYFAQAANGFDKVVKSGVTNGKLLYNLGNAQVQAKQIGSGIGSYLQAQRIMPGDSQLQSNLAHARSLVKDRFDSGGGILMEDVSDWWHLISFNSRLTLAGIFWIAAWSIAAFLLHQPAAARHETARVLVRRAAWGLAICGVFLARPWSAISPPRSCGPKASPPATASWCAKAMATALIRNSPSHFLKALNFACCNGAQVGFLFALAMGNLAGSPQRKPPRREPWTCVERARAACPHKKCSLTRFTSSVILAFPSSRRGA